MQSCLPYFIQNTTAKITSLGFFTFVFWLGYLGLLLVFKQQLLLCYQLNSFCLLRLPSSLPPSPSCAFLRGSTLITLPCKLGCLIVVFPNWWCPEDRCNINNTAWWPFSSFPLMLQRKQWQQPDCECAGNTAWHVVRIIPLSLQVSSSS